MSYQRILVPLDGSKFAEAAIEFLPFIAASGAHVRLLTVVEEGFGANVQPILTSPMNPDFAVVNLAPKPSSFESREICLDYLQTIQNRLAASGYHVSIEAGNGHVAETIVTAGGSSCDAILMATHGRTGLSKLIVGSVAEAVLHRAECPVVVVPIHLEQLQRFPHKKDNIPRILISLDGTPESETILPLVEKLLDKQPAKIVLVRVLQSYDTIPEGMEPHTDHALRAELQHDSNNILGDVGELAMRRYLDQIAERFNDGSEQVICEVGFAQPVQEILFFADLYRVDLIAMATHGRIGLARLLRGSVTESVLHKAPCPMLISHISQSDPVIPVSAPATLTSR